MDELQLYKNKLAENGFVMTKNIIQCFEEQSIHSLQDWLNKQDLFLLKEIGTKIMKASLVKPDIEDQETLLFFQDLILLISSIAASEGVWDLKDNDFEPLTMHFAHACAQEAMIREEILERTESFSLIKKLPRLKKGAKFNAFIESFDLPTTIFNFNNAE